MSNLYRLNLTGMWGCDDGGTYYIRQIGNTVAWYGEKDPINPEWSNVANGYIRGSELFLKWMDVPKGGIMQSGHLVIKVSDDELIITDKTGGFGGNFFQRIRKPF